jgi:hypothetical protein
MAAVNKCLALDDKSSAGREATNKRDTRPDLIPLEMRPMKPTNKIRFTEPQIALVMRAHPNSNLDRLTEVSFEFDHSGKIIDCIGTISSHQPTSFEPFSGFEAY